MLTLVIILNDEWVVRPVHSSLQANEIIAGYSSKKFAAFLYGVDGKLISANVELDL
jgi:hypothetical protein